MYSSGPNHPILLASCQPALVWEIASSIQAGFPSPAEDHAVKRVDLNDVLVKHPLSTFTMRVSGPSMRGMGIDDGDVVVVDRSIKACHGHVVVAIIDSEFTIKRLDLKNGFRLEPANPDFKSIVPVDPQQAVVWGVVTHAIKAMPK